MSKNKNYVQGRAFEYKIATLFRRKGYYVVRSAGSHGPADLVAVKKGLQPILIQCKTGNAGISTDERDILYLTAKETGSIAIVASKEARKPTLFVRLIGFSTSPQGGEMAMKESEF